MAGIAYTGSGGVLGLRIGYHINVEETDDSNESNNCYI